MLTLTIPDTEFFDNFKQEFIQIKGQTITMEHSLVSLSKWESKFQKPFLLKTNLTSEEIRYYLECMTITQNVNPLIYYGVNDSLLAIIYNYIEAPMTATTISSYDDKKKINREIVTAEIIYYWMIALNIPKEFEKWHLNRLLTLINVCNIKNQPPKKMSKKNIYSRNHELNKARRSKLNTSG